MEGTQLSLDLVEYKERKLVWLRMPETLQDLQPVFDVLTYMTENLPWAWGDAWLMSSAVLGESASQLLPDPKRTPKTLANWAHVCQCFPPESRIYELSFSHYSECANLDPDRRDELLRTAELEEWTTSELRKMIHGERPKLKKFAECPCCHAELQIEGSVLIPMPETVMIDDGSAEGVTE